MLNIIHGTHMGAEKCKCRAKEVLYWSGMNSQIENVVSNCQTCSMKKMMMVPPRQMIMKASQHRTLQSRHT